MLIGLHCSIRSGYLGALKEAEELGCRAMQIFSYRRHEHPAQELLCEFARARERSSVRVLLTHARYLPYLASSEETRWKRSVKLLQMEFNYSCLLGADYLILHVGAYSPGASRGAGLERFVSALKEIQGAEQGGTGLLVENVPGGGRRLGGSLEELSLILEGLSGWKGLAGICWDVAHAWAYGYNIGSRQGMEDFLAEFERKIGLDRLRAFHIQDSLVERGSHRENHHHLGCGKLGEEGLKLLARKEAFRDRPAILETPREAVWDRKNIRILNEYLGSFHGRDAL